MNNSVSEGLRQSLNRNVLSWPVAGLTVFFSVMLHLAGSTDLPVEQYGPRMVAATVSVAPLFLVVAVAVIVSRAFAVAPLWIILGSYLFGAALRGAALSFFIQELGFADGGGWPYRIPASVLSMTATLLVSTFVVTNIREHRRLIADLELESENLRDALNEVTIRNIEQHDQRLSSLAGEIVQEMERIQLVPVDEQITEIELLVAERVRPLSHRFSEEVRPWRPHNVASEPPRFLHGWRKLNPVADIPPTWFALAMSVAAFPTAWGRYGLGTALSVVLWTSLVLVVTAHIGYHVAQRLMPRLPVPWNWVTFTGILLVIAAVGVATTVFVLRNQTDPYIYVASGLIAFPAYAWAIAIAGHYFNQSIAQQVAMRDLNSKLQWAIARVNLLTWYRQGLNSRIFHGSIQNLLHATVLRLREKPGSQRIEDVIAQLHTVLSEPERSTDIGAVSSDGPFSEIIALWSSLAAISVDVSLAARDRLAHDRALGTIVVDLMNELCSNAIRHGNATELSISILAEDEVLKVELIDNGARHDERASKGLGTRFLDNCSLDWSYERVSDENLLRVRLPSLDSFEQPAPKR